MTIHLLRDTDDVVAHEIVGLYARILKSRCNSLKYMRGKIVLETKNTLLVETNFGLKRVGKKAAELIKLQEDSSACFISGSSMIGRPEDRVLRVN